MTTATRFMNVGVWLAMLLLVCAGALAGEQEDKARFTTGLDFGYSSGLHVQMSGMISNFASDFPLSVRAGIGYSTFDPGNATEARRIFINNATNGVPEKQGDQLAFRCDFLYPVELLTLKRSYLYFGPKYVRFKGNFKYVGGNEDFDVKSNLWGIGGGIESHFPISRKVDLVLSGGLDYYPSGNLSGHDTSYSPDGEDVNPRKGYTYADADNAINQPKFSPRFTFGFAYKF